jgi:Glycosyl hydrolases family 43
MSPKLLKLTVFILALSVMFFVLNLLPISANETVLFEISLLWFLSSFICIAWVFYIFRYSRIWAWVCFAVGIAPFILMVWSSLNPIVVINDVDPRCDIKGQIIDAHDGCLQFFNGRFYLYGTASGETDGFTNNSFHVYSSPDLQNWTLEGELLKDRPNAIYYRPYVVFNPNTHKYVLWYNWYPDRYNWIGHEGVAIGDTPVGPFTTVNSDVRLAHPNNGDGSLFVDDDGTGYFIYTSIADNYTVHVEKLTKDFLYATGQTSQPLTDGVEAPVLFRRGDLYYGLCGPRCAFCPEGSEVQVFTATSPLGPYTTDPQANINCRNQNTAQSTNGRIVLAGNYPIVSAQQTWVAKIPTAKGTLYLWMGDRWQSCLDGFKGHDFQYWAPLKFSSDGRILPLEGLAHFWFKW